MELVKLSEAYTINDNNEMWMSSGLLNKDINGNITINITTTLKQHEGESDFIGTMTYNKPVTGHINAIYTFGQDSINSFIEYCENLVKSILEQIK